MTAMFYIVGHGKQAVKDVRKGEGALIVERRTRVGELIVKSEKSDDSHCCKYIVHHILKGRFRSRAPACRIEIRYRVDSRGRDIGYPSRDSNLPFEAATLLVAAVFKLPSSRVKTRHF